MSDALLDNPPFPYPEGDTRNVASFPPEVKAVLLEFLTKYQQILDEEVNNKLKAEGHEIRFVVGLRAQGHLPLIERMRNGGYDWPDIARAIGYDNPEGVRLWYLAEKD